MKKRLIWKVSCLCMADLRQNVEEKVVQEQMFPFASILVIDVLHIVLLVPSSGKTFVGPCVRESMESHTEAAKTTSAVGFV